jgi:hypothetical protein
VQQLRAATQADEHEAAEPQAAQVRCPGRAWEATAAEAAKEAKAAREAEAAKEAKVAKEVKTAKAAKEAKAATEGKDRCSSATSRVCRLGCWVAGWAAGVAGWLTVWTSLPGATALYHPERLVFRPLAGLLAIERLLSKLPVRPAQSGGNLCLPVGVGGGRLGTVTAPSGTAPALVVTPPGSLGGNSSDLAIG